MRGTKRVSARGDAAVSDETRAFPNIELGAGDEGRMRCCVVSGQPDSRMGARPRVNGVAWASHELDIEEPAVAAAHAKLRPIRDGPFGTEVERRPPASFVNREELDPNFHVSGGAVGFHERFTLLTPAVGVKS